VEQVESLQPIEYILNRAGELSQRGATLTVISRGGLNQAGALTTDQVKSFRWLDLDHEYTLETQLAIVTQALRHTDQETVAIYRDDQRYVPRLRPGTTISVDQGIFALSLPDSPEPGQGIVLIQPRPDDPFLADCGHKEKPAQESSGIIRQSLLALPPDERSKVLEEFLRREFASITGLTLSDADLDKPLHSFGLDSLMAIQLRNRVEAELKISLSLVDFLKGLSLSQIVTNANQEMAGPTAEISKTSEGSESSLGVLNADHVEKLSEGELDRFLQSLLEVERQMSSVKR
jgi:hypothetical protein